MAAPYYMCTSTGHRPCGLLGTVSSNRERRVNLDDSSAAISRTNNEGHLRHIQFLNVASSIGLVGRFSDERAGKSTRDRDQASSGVGLPLGCSPFIKNREAFFRLDLIHIGNPLSFIISTHTIRELAVSMQ